MRGLISAIPVAALLLLVHIAPVTGDAGPTDQRGLDMLAQVPEPAQPGLARLVAIVLDRSDWAASPARADFMKALTTREIYTLDAANARARQEPLEHGDRLAEWALFAFNRTDAQLIHDFTQEPWRSYEAAREAFNHAMPESDAGGHAVRPVIWAVTQTLIHAHEQGRGGVAQVVVVSSGDGPPPAAGQDAIERLNAVLTRLALPLPERPQAALPLLPGAGPLLSLPMALLGAPQTLGEPGQSAQTALAELEQVAATTQLVTRVGVVAVDVQPGSPAEALLRSIAEAGGGPYISAGSGEDPAGVVNGLQAGFEGSAPANTGGQVAMPPPTTPGTGVGTTPTEPITPGTAQPGTTGRQPEDLTITIIICRDIVNGEPVDAADHFDAANKLWGRLRIEGLPTQTHTDVMWLWEGQVVYNYTMPMKVSVQTARASLDMTQAGGIWPGHWELRLEIGGATIASKLFTVGATAPETQVVTAEPPAPDFAAPGYTLVVCRDVSDQQPVDPADSFEAVSEVSAVLTVPEARAADTIVAT